MDEILTGCNDSNSLLQEVNNLIREINIVTETFKRTNSTLQTLQNNDYGDNMGSAHTPNTENTHDNNPEASNTNQEDVNSRSEDNDDVIFIDSQNPETQASNHIVSTTDVSDDVIFVGSVTTTSIDLSTPTDNIKTNQCQERLQQSVVRRRRKNSSITSTCSICLENPFYKNPTSTTCGHIFCKECIKRAVQNSKKCPNCQQKLGLKSMHPIYI